MIYHMVAFLMGFLCDCCFGDPYWMPHPVRLIGHTISFIEKKSLEENDDSSKKQRNGLFLVFLVCGLTIVITGSLMYLAYWIHPIMGACMEALFSYFVLAAKSLKTESMKVYKALKDDGLDAARHAVSMIVGRDTKELTSEGVIKASVETVAENTSDGVIAPMMYLAIGGPILGMLYKAINTMDSMVGYKNEKYLYYGRYAAKLDDIVNYIPSRLSAYLMIVAAFILPKAYSGKNALRIYKRDRYNHASPNSAQTEAACAGALSIKLAGPAYYFGQLYDKPYIGDSIREIELEDIKRSNRLMYMTTVLGVFVFSIAMLSIMLGHMYIF